MGHRCWPPIRGRYASGSYAVAASARINLTAGFFHEGRNICDTLDAEGYAADLTENREIYFI